MLVAVGCCAFRKLPEELMLVGDTNILHRFLLGLANRYFCYCLLSKYFDSFFLRVALVKKFLLTF